MNRQFQRMLAGIIVIMFSVMTLAPTSHALRIRKEKRVKNNWSFQIMADNRVDDDSYDGVRFALKRNFSKSESVRFSLGLVERQSYHHNRVVNSNGSMMVFDNQNDFDLEGVSLSIQYLYAPSRNGNTSFYWGIGPYLSYEETNPDILIIQGYNIPFDGAADIVPGETGLIGLGAEWSFGLELFLGKNVSLLGEYGVTIQNRWHVVEIDYYDNYGHKYRDRETFDDGVHVDASRIKLGLAVHF